MQVILFLLEITIERTPNNAAIVFHVTYGINNVSILFLIFFINNFQSHFCKPIKNNRPEIKKNVGTAIWVRTFVNVIPVILNNPLVENNGKSASIKLMVVGFKCIKITIIANGNLNRSMDAD